MKFNFDQLTYTLQPGLPTEKNKSQPIRDSFTTVLESTYNRVQGKLNQTILPSKRTDFLRSKVVSVGVHSA